VDGFDDDVSPAEIAREKRRDRDADAQARAGMRTGLAKQFKQVLDSQTKRVQDDERRAMDRETPPAEGRSGKPAAPARKSRRRNS
jgi:hypothetical protein